MKHVKLKVTQKILIGVFAMLCFGCQETTVDMPAPVGSDDQFQGVADWQDLLPAIIAPSSIIVEKDGSVQAAIDQAAPGEVIYITPGIYQEHVSIEKADISLIGIDGPNGEKVEFTNLKVSGSPNISVENIRGIDGVYPLKLQTDLNNHRQMRKFKMKRKLLKTDVAYYSFEIRLGDGPYDIINLHRVVAESRPYHPIRTTGEVFMVHGSSQDFEDIFYIAGAPDVSPGTSSPTYLAANGIDVWGISLGWTKVPLEETNFDFMESWDINKDISHTLSAMSMARIIRGLTGQGFGKLNLLGFSYGGFVAYGAAGKETQQHNILRDIKGLIPVDMVMKFEPVSSNEGSIQNACDQAAATLANINNGVFVDDVSAFLVIADLAENDPKGQSPFAPGLTNRQFFLALAVFPSEAPNTPAWHFAGGSIKGLLYTDYDRWLYLVKGLSPYQPLLTRYELSACICDQADVELDDHLSDIDVPILYVGAGGGFGNTGFYSTTLTASRDITHLNIRITKNPFEDFGHADLLMARDAPTLVWQPVYDWLVIH